MIISAHIDVTKILKEHLVKGAKGTYLNIDLKDGVHSEYGDDFLVTQDLGSEARKQGRRGPILGNAKYLSRQPMAPKSHTATSTTTTIMKQEGNQEDVPF